MTRRRWAFDAGVAAMFGIAMGVATAVFPRDPGTLFDLPRPALYAVTVVSTLVLACRRRFPVGSTSVIAAVTVLAPYTYFVPATLYAAAAWSRRRATAVWGLWVAMNAAIVVGDAGWRDFRFNDRALGLFVTTVSVLAGLYVGTRRTMIVSATERAERAEREQELLAEQARAEERVRLAAEMHDVVTHRINLMVLQAGALGVHADEPGVRDAAEELRLAGTQALAELRDLVGVLRAGRTLGSTSEDEVPVGELDALVDEVRAVGVAVTLHVRGDPGALGPAVRRTLHRVVQESLTNARKHAARAPVTVEVHYGVDSVVATVSNTVPGGPVDDPVVADLAASGGGAGLDGLRHRTSMLGGTLRAGPAPDGGFTVHAELPAVVPTADHAPKAVPR